MEAAGLIAINPILSGLDVYKALVFHLSLKKCYLNFKNSPELCDSYHQKSDLSTERGKSKLLP